MKQKMRRILLIEPRRFVIEEVDRPLPGANEVLIRVVCVGVCGSDIAALHGKHPYIRCPIVLGHEFSGVVVKGAALAPGTRVAVIPHLVCGSCDACRREDFNLCENLRCIGAQADGAHAEYVVVPAPMVLPIPAQLTLKDAALIEPAAVAWHGVKRASIMKNESVLVVGAGPIGIFAMQSAKVLAAKAVYIADLISDRLSLASSLGADGTIDLSKESLIAGLDRLAGGPKQIAVLMDCVGGRGTVLNQLITLARRGSRIVMIGVLNNEYDIPDLPDFVEHELTFIGTAMYAPRDYREVIKNMTSGHIRTSGMITHFFDFNNIPDAFAMVEAGKEKFFKIMFVSPQVGCL